MNITIFLGREERIIGMKTLDLSVKFDADLEQYQIFDREHPDVILATAYTKESAYQKMLNLAIAGATVSG